MPKRYYPQKGLQERKMIEYNINKIKYKRASVPSITNSLPEILSLLILKDDTIRFYSTNPYMNSKKFEDSEKFNMSCAIASLLIANYNLKLIKSPHLLCYEPKKFVASTNLNFPQNLGVVSGLTRNQKFIELNYEKFSKKIESILTNNLNFLDNSSESYARYLPTEKLKLQSEKLCQKIKKELQNIKEDPYYLHLLFEAIQVLTTTKKSDYMLKGEKQCQ